MTAPVQSMRPLETEAAPEQSREMVSWQGRLWKLVPWPAGGICAAVGIVLYNSYPIAAYGCFIATACNVTICWRDRGMVSRQELERHLAVTNAAALEDRTQREQLRDQNKALIEQVNRWQKEAELFKKNLDEKVSAISLLMNEKVGDIGAVKEQMRNSREYTDKFVQGTEALARDIQLISTEGDELGADIVRLNTNIQDLAKESAGIHQEGEKLQQLVQNLKEFQKTGDEQKMLNSQKNELELLLVEYKQLEGMQQLLDSPEVVRLVKAPKLLEWLLAKTDSELKEIVISH